MKAAFVAAFLAQDASARFFVGKCPKPEAMKTLDVDQYAGMWYGQEYDYMFPFTLIRSTCNFKKFTKNDDGNLDLWFGATSDLFGATGVNGELFCKPDEFVHKKHAETCEANMHNKNQHIPFAVLATDYKNYDVGYYCMDLMPEWLSSRLPFGFSTDIATIYSREKTMSAEDLEAARAIIKEKVPEYNWHISRMTAGSQDGCDYAEVPFKGWGSYMKEAKAMAIKWIPFLH